MSVVMGQGHFAVLQDPQGAHFSIFQSANR
jgi:predicted enzyme related to lactoylglutathione lyase